MVTAGDELGVAVPATAWGEVVPLPENAAGVLAVRRLAKSLARGRSNRRLPNPLVLHGPPGSGKTLLIQTLIRKLSAGESAATARVVPARELTDLDPTDAVAVDLLVVEDVQHLPAKEAVRFADMLDARTSRHRPTVITGSGGPAQLPRLPRRLTSRLAAGLVVGLAPIGRASRKLLLERLAGKKRLTVSDDALDWLAGRLTGGRDVSGAMVTLAAASRGRAVPLDLAAVQSAFASEPALAVGLKRIVGRVAEAFAVTPADLRGPSRQRTYLLPRQVAMLLAREVGRLSLPQIGAAFGGRDHTTVLHACRKVTEAVQHDAKLRRTVADLRAELG